MDFKVLNEEAAPYAGLNGWLRTDPPEVYLCARVNHLRVLEKGFLDGIAEGEVYEERQGSWYAIREWAAQRGWVHFVHHEERDRMRFVVVSIEQRKVCERFARSLDLMPEFANDWVK